MIFRNGLRMVSIGLKLLVMLTIVLALIHAVIGFMQFIVIFEQALLAA